MEKRDGEKGINCELFGDAKDNSGTSLKEKFGIKWDDVKEMLEMIDSFDKFKDVVLNVGGAREKFFEKLTDKGGTVLRQALYARLKDPVTKALEAANALLFPCTTGGRRQLQVGRLSVQRH